MKIIQAFRENDHALVLDLIDARASVCIDKEAGHIQFNEGQGLDRYDGIAARASSFKKFQIQGGKLGKVFLHFAGQAHLLGTTNDLKGAQEWTEKAARLLSSKQNMDSSRQKAPQASKANFDMKHLAKSA
jgi:hypothetical protein